MSNNPVEVKVRTRLRVFVYVAIILAAMAIVLSVLSLVFLKNVTSELMKARNALERAVPSQSLED